MVCYDLHDEGASKISIRIIINVFFNNIRKHLIEINMLWKVSKSKSGTSIDKLDEYFYLHDF